MPYYDDWKLKSPPELDSEGSDECVFSDESLALRFRNLEAVSCRCSRCVEDSFGAVRKNLSNASRCDYVA